jgi:polysaccharide deacetylase family protein (PEP-CTERM system associated)
MSSDILSEETLQRPSPQDVSPWKSQNAFTVDVEDYFQVSAFEGDIDRAEWDRFPRRVVDNTLRLLEKLAAHETRATFFVLGWVAQRNPDLIAEISRAGHEIGSHSYWHRLIYQMSPEEFRQDLQLSRSSLEEITGQPVRLFRAPSFSITRRSLWAL